MITVGPSIDRDSAYSHEVASVTQVRSINRKPHLYARACDHLHRAPLNEVIFSGHCVRRRVGAVALAERWCQKKEAEHVLISRM